MVPNSLTLYTLEDLVVVVVVVIMVHGGVVADMEPRK